MNVLNRANLIEKANEAQALDNERRDIMRNLVENRAVYGSDNYGAGFIKNRVVYGSDNYGSGLIKSKKAKKNLWINYLNAFNGVPRKELSDNYKSKKITRKELVKDIGNVLRHSRTRRRNIQGLKRSGVSKYLKNLGPRNKKYGGCGIYGGARYAPLSSNPYVRFVQYFGNSNRDKYMKGMTIADVDKLAKELNVPMIPKTEVQQLEEKLKEAKMKEKLTFMSAKELNKAFEEHIDDKALELGLTKAEARKDPRVIASFYAFHNLPLYPTTDDDTIKDYELFTEIKKNEKYAPLFKYLSPKERKLKVLNNKLDMIKAQIAELNK